MPLREIRIELARTPEFPDGSVERGYEFRAPLTEDGHLDHDEWPAVRGECTMRRFWHNEPDETGRLIHRGGGWAFHFDGHSSEDDEPVYKLDRHRLVEGEYITITELDHEARTFRVVRVR